MANDIAISVKNLSKKYHLYDSPKHRLKEALHPFRKKYHKEFWALKDVSFEVKKGESIGIIGKNGSGKSTLLQILCGVLQKTTGEVVVNGKVSALLELGAGFNPELTGRENVYMNGAIMGFNKEEMDERVQAIIEFADIGEFIDQPVKIYSSGMFVSLAFALAMCVEPDILIVDEAFSVGDFFFQQKCFKKLRGMKDSGLTLLFVSHDMGTVRDLCSTAVYLRKGKLEYVGDSKTAVRAYLSERSPTAPPQSASNVSPTIAPPQAANLELAEIKKTALWSVADDKEEGRRLLAVRLLGADGQTTSHANIGDTVKIQVFFRTAPGEAGHISFTLKNRYDQVVSNIGTYLLGMEACSSGNVQFAVAEFEVGLMLEAGLYSLMLAFGQPTQQNQGKMIDDTGWIGPIHITWDYETQRAPFLGMFGLPISCKMIEPNKYPKTAVFKASSR